jgi:hypothetical protein
MIRHAGPWQDVERAESGRPGLVMRIAAKILAFLMFLLAFSILIFEW